MKGKPVGSKKISQQVSPKDRSKHEEDDFIKNIVTVKQKKIFDVTDIQMHLEELTEDEEEIRKKSPRA